MRSRGWAGATPASDEEAISRILSAVDDEIAEDFGLATQAAPGLEIPASFGKPRFHLTDR